MPFIDIISKLQANTYKYEPDNFKYSCLTATSSLFETNQIQIGLISKDLGSSKISFTLHYGNKMDEQFPSVCVRVNYQNCKSFSFYSYLLENVMSVFPETIN